MAAVDKTIPIAPTSEERTEFLKTLPKLPLDELPQGDYCPICLVSFSTILEDEESIPEERKGVTKLQCGHIFCMADIFEWVDTLRGSCPTCRDLFLIIPEVADDESSDGGEYIPGSDSVADDMMDGDTWSDEEMWTDGEMSLDEGITEGETDSSWERSSEGVSGDIDENQIPSTGQLDLPMDNAFIAETQERSYHSSPYDDTNCEQIQTELAQWRAQVERIQVEDWILKRDDTSLTIHRALCAIRDLKPRIQATERDASAKLSFVHSTLEIMHDIGQKIETKLDMLDEIDRGFSPQEARS